MSSAVIALDPSVPLIAKFLSATETVKLTSLEALFMSSTVVPSSLISTLAPPASSIISPAASTVMSVASEVMVSSAMLPTLVMSASLNDVAPNVLTDAVEVLTAPADYKPPVSNVMETSTAPFISIDVAVRSISSVAAIDKTVALEP